LFVLHLNLKYLVESIIRDIVLDNTYSYCWSGKNRLILNLLHLPEKMMFYLI